MGSIGSSGTIGAMGSIGSIGTIGSNGTVGSIDTVSFRGTTALVVTNTRSHEHTSVVIMSILYIGTFLKVDNLRRNR